MQYKVTSTTRPERVRLELYDGRTIVRLADNITSTEGEDGVAYAWNEVEFDAPDDRTLTAESVEAEFSAWWSYGTQDFTEPTIEQRVSDLEDALLAMMEG